MRRTSSQAGKILTAGVLTALTVVTLGLSGCASQPEEERDASWLLNKMRVCVQNKTANPISLKWDSYMQGDDGEYLPASDLTKTLGPEAFSCAVSYAFVGAEIADFSVQGTPVEISAGDADWFTVYVLGSSDPIEIKPGVSEKHPLGDQQLMWSARVKDELKTVGKVKAYPIDFYISE